MLLSTSIFAGRRTARSWAECCPMKVSAYPDAWLWAGIVAFYGLAIRAIPKQLTFLRDAMVINAPEQASQMISQSTQDAINLESLAILTTSPNLNIREVTATILKSRLDSSSEAWDVLIKDLASSKLESRHRALTILRFCLTEQMSIPRPLTVVWCQPRFLSALVRCLQRQLPSVRAAAQENHHLSSDTEYALEIVNHMLCHHRETCLEQLLKAGFVDQWLGRLPFDMCSDLPKRNRKAEYLRDLMKMEEREVWQSQDLKNVLENLLSSSVGSESMVVAGLWDRSFDVGDNHVRNNNGNAEQVELRRRRREAVVVGEEGRPIEREDVIVGGNGVRDLDAEHILDQLREAQTAATQSSHMDAVLVAHIQSLASWMQSRLPLR